MGSRQSSSRCIAKERSRASGDQESDTVLVMGVSGCGKRTLCRQMRLLYGEPLTEEERLGYVPAVHRHTLHGVADILAGLEAADLALDRPYCHQDADRLRRLLKAAKADGGSLAPFFNTADFLVQRLCEEPAVKKIITENTSAFRDNLDYFLKEINHTGCSDYVPTDEDIARVRVAGEGVETCKVTLRQKKKCKVNYTFRSIREAKRPRGFGHMFRNVRAVMFLLPLGDYDVPVVTGGKPWSSSVLKESLDRLSQTANDQTLSNAVIMIILNKCDVFREKLKRVPLKTVFPAYQGPNEYKACVKYLQGLAEKITSRDSCLNSCFVYRHQINTTDKEDVSATLEPCLKAVTMINDLIEVGIL